MRRRVAMALSVLIVAAVPAIVVGNALWVLLHPWFVEAQYALPGFPEDRHGLRDRERTDLATTALRSIQPQGKGAAALHEARLPSGQPAFGEREIGHMEDVRGVVAGFLVAWAVALAITVAAGLSLRRLAGSGRVRRAITSGALLTVAVMAVIGMVMLVDFDAFFDGFHGIFFQGDSWRFDNSLTLRRLYPDTFWGIAGGTMAGLVLLQAAALALAGGRKRHSPTRAATVG